MDEKRLDRDELARRRALRAQRTEGGAQAHELDDEEPPRLSWGETFAMVIAAYQVLLPPLLAIVGAMGVIYLLFVYVF
ncbi:MAG TPA: hypothetical protein VK191_17440 [Symbiobacteriaceae bacterium]|nr:hypothetical protein [Symbiobacteriaceae bacterium]